MDQNDDLINLAGYAKQFEIPPPVRPHEVQISQTIAFVRRRLNNPAMDVPVNRSVKEGYTEAIRVLAENVTDSTLR